MNVNVFASARWVYLKTEYLPRLLDVKLTCEQIQNCLLVRRPDEPSHDKTNKMACAPSEESDQPGYPPSLIRAFAVRMKKHWVLSYPLSALQRPWSDWAEAQADMSFRWTHRSFCWFCHEVVQMTIRPGKLVSSSPQRGELNKNVICAFSTGGKRVWKCNRKDLHHGV